jgi:hypothetical protein
MATTYRTKIDGNEIIVRRYPDGATIAFPLWVGRKEALRLAKHAAPYNWG